MGFGLCPSTCGCPSPARIQGGGGFKLQGGFVLLPESLPLEAALRKPFLLCPAPTRLSRRPQLPVCLPNAPPIHSQQEPHPASKTLPGPEPCANSPGLPLPQGFWTLQPSSTDTRALPCHLPIPGSHLLTSHIWPVSPTGHWWLLGYSGHC